MNDISRETLNNRQNEIDNLGFIKIIMMICVVLYHSFYVWGNTSGGWKEIYVPMYQSSVLPFTHDFLLLFHTRTFMICSGFLFFFLKHEKNKYQNKFLFIFNKFLRLIIPGIFIILCTIMPIKLALGVETPWYVFLFRALTLGFIDQTWFIAALFWIFVVFILLDKFIEKHHWIFLVIFLILNVGMIMINEFTEIQSVAQIFNGLEFLLYFYLGYKMRQFNFVKLRNIKWWIYLLFIVLSYGLSVVLQLSQNEVIHYIGYGLKLVYFYIFPICVFYMLQGIADKINKNNKIYQFINKRTMLVYLFHQQIIYLCLTFIPEINPWLNGSINFIISFVGAALIGSLMILTKPTAFLVGEKAK